MSYKNPTVPVISPATGFDAVIESIRTALSGITWLEKSFGRAWSLKEKNQDNREVTLAKVYLQSGEYLNVLPNDNLKAQSFIVADGPEEWEQFNRFEGSIKRRRIAVVFWMDLKNIDLTKDYVYTEVLKPQVEKILEAHPATKSLDAYYDEKAEDIFRGFTLDDVDTQYLMFPYGGMRFELTVLYDEVC